MAANVEAMLREGIDALKSGRRDDARTLFLKVVDIDQLNEQGWLWLSAVVETVEDQQTCLENVLQINPANERARQGLQYIAQQKASGSMAPIISGAPLSPKAPPAPSAMSGSSTAKSDTLSTSVEWSAPADSPAAASKRPGLDLSDDDLDNWVSTLNLPSTPAPAQPLTTSPFVDNDEIDVFERPSTGRPAGPPGPPPPPARRSSAKPKTEERRASAADDAPAAFFAGIEEDEAEEIVEHEPLFPDIPDEIRATRLPGTRQRLPIWLMLALAVVIALNLIATLFLVQRLGA